jgi:hypothetical protein
MRAHVCSFFFLAKFFSCPKKAKNFFCNTFLPRDAFLKQHKGHDIVAFSWEFNFKSEALGLFTT